MMSNSRAGVRSRPGAVRETGTGGGRGAGGRGAGSVREGRALPKARSGESTRSAGRRGGAEERRRPAVPISVPPSPSTPSRRPAVASRAPFVVLVLVLAVGGLVGLVLLNTAVNENAFRLHDLDTQQQQLDKEEQRLQQALENQESPQKLAERAKKMGLVPAGDPGFVVLPDGKIVGTPAPASAPPSPTPTASAPASPSGSADDSSEPADTADDDASDDADGGSTSVEPTPSAAR